MQATWDDMARVGEQRVFGRRGVTTPGPATPVRAPRDVSALRAPDDVQPDTASGVSGTRETPAFGAFESVYPKIAGAIGAAGFIAYLMQQPSMRSTTGVVIACAVSVIFYRAVKRSFEGLREWANTLHRVRTTGLRSRSFAIGALVGGLFFVVNDRLDAIPLSLTDAVIRVTFGSQEAMIAAVDKTGIMENIDTTFAMKNGVMSVNRTHADGTVSDPERNKAEWARVKDMLEHNKKLMWFVDLVSIAAACGFALKTVMGWVSRDTALRTDVG